MLTQDNINKNKHKTNSVSGQNPDKSFAEIKPHVHFCPNLINFVNELDENGLVYQNVFENGESSEDDLSQFLELYTLHFLYALVSVILVNQTVSVPISGSQNILQREEIH